MTMPLPILRGISKTPGADTNGGEAAATPPRPHWNPGGEGKGRDGSAPGPQEEAWLRSAYRQGVNPYAFAQGDPIDPALEGYYRESGNVPAGQVYVGPDGRYRRINDAVREDPEINAIRMRAWDGVKFGDLDRLNQSLGGKHPGEDQAVARMSATPVQAPTGQALPSEKTVMTSFGPMRLPSEASGLGQGLKPVADRYSGSGITSAVAAAEGGGRMPAAPGPEPIAPFSPNSYSTSTIGPAANDNVSSVGAPSSMLNVAPETSLSGSNIQPVEGIGSDPTALDLPDNVRARANHDRTPQSAVHTLMDDPFFGEWLSNRKRYWQETTENPDGIAEDKREAAYTLAKEAFGSLMGYRRESDPEKREAAFNAILPFATELVNRAYEPGEEYRYRPEAKFLKPNPRLADITGLVDSLSFGLPTAFGGRPGSEQTQAHVGELKTRLSEALKNCGAKIIDERFSERERQIQLNERENLGSVWPDIEVTFEAYDSDRKPISKFALYVNHASTYANGSLKPGEQRQINGQIINLAKAVGEKRHEDYGEFYDSGVEAFRKKFKKETLESYLADMDKFVQSVVDCSKTGYMTIKIRKPVTETEGSAANSN